MESYFEINEELGMIAYATPVVMQGSCMACHGDPANSLSGDGKDPMGFAMEGWAPGDRRGAYILTAPISKIEEQVAGIEEATIKWALALILLTCMIVFFGVKKLNHSLTGMMNQILRALMKCRLLRRKFRMRARRSPKVLRSKRLRSRRRPLRWKK